MTNIRKALFPIEPNQSAASKEDCKDQTALTSLKQDIFAQEKQRIKVKYERLMQNKELQFSKLTKRYQQIENAYKQVKNMNQELAHQKQYLLQQKNRIQHQANENKTKIVNEYRQKIQILEKQLVIFKDGSTKISGELRTSQDRMQLLEKEHKVALRRCNTLFQETRAQLESKLTVRQKQQEKVEALFEQKKQQHSQIIAEKEEEIAILIQENNTLRTERDRLQTQVDFLQKERINDRQLEQEMKVLNEAVTQTQLLHASFVKDITQSLHGLRDTLSLEAQDSDLIKLIEKMKSELLNRKDVTQFEQAIAKHEQETKIVLHQNKELAHKIKVLEDQIAFLRSRNVDCQDFASIIKSHMQEIDQKIMTVELPQKPKSVRPPEKPIEPLPTQSYHSQQLLPFHLGSERKPQRREGRVIENYMSAPKGKSSSDFLKEELQTKKKSLIYLMYRPDEKQNHKDQPAPQKKQQAASIPARKRSSSLGNLISAKCREQIG